MATSFSLDFKLLFNSLAQSNGCIRLETILQNLPADIKETPSYIQYWKTAVDKDGLLTWSSFNKGLQESFKNTDTSQSTATLQQQQDKETISTAELETALFHCSKSNLINALTSTRKEVYKSNMPSACSPRKEHTTATLQRSHHRSYSTGQSLPKDIPSNEREKIVLQQLEELLRERTQEKGGMSSSNQAMINEVLKQLKSILRRSRVSTTGSTDQLNLSTSTNTSNYTTNPYATIRRTSSHRSSHYPANTSTAAVVDPLVRRWGTGVHRSTSMPGNHHAILPVDTEPPPPYSPSPYSTPLAYSPTSSVPYNTTNVPLVPHASSPKKSSMSMTNLINVGTAQHHTTNTTTAVPQVVQQHNHVTRQTLEMWKQAQMEAETHRKTSSKELSKHYRSSPELSQEQQLTKEEIQTAQMYGTILRNKSSKKKTSSTAIPHQQQSILHAQSIQIQRLENEKDLLIKTIFENKALCRSPTHQDDSILEAP